MKTFGWEVAMTANDKKAVKAGSTQLLESTYKSYNKAVAGAEDCVKKSKVVSLIRAVRLQKAALS
jgi:beta-N-acetylglucosaminidase